MCIYNFLYMIIYSYVYTLVNHKCIVNWIGSLNALNSKLVVFVTLVIMYLLAQWCASSKRAGLTNFWCLCHCIWIFTRFCSSFWHWKRCCVHAFHVFHVFLFLEWKISSRKKGVSIGYIMRASSFPVYLRSLSSVIWVLQKKNDRFGWTELYFGPVERSRMFAILEVWKATRSCRSLMSMVLATFQIGASFFHPGGGEDSWYSCTAKTGWEVKLDRWDSLPDFGLWDCCDWRRDWKHYMSSKHQTSPRRSLFCHFFEPNIWVKSLLDLKQLNLLITGRLILGTADFQIFAPGRFLHRCLTSFRGTRHWTVYTRSETLRFVEHLWNRWEAREKQLLKAVGFWETPQGVGLWFKVQVLRGAFFGEETDMATIRIRSWVFLVV